MPKSKSTPRKGGTLKPATLSIPAAKPGFDPAQLKRGKAGRSQRFGRGKPPRFPGRTGGR
ncbi:MAG: hypothetical protein OXC60_03395 [Litoreibacter sp.]|nr:hypothetical protein [Litoreibacter sp.]